MEKSATRLLIVDDEETLRLEQDKIRLKKQQTNNINHSQNPKVLIEDGRIAERVEVDASPVASEYHLTEHDISLYKVLAELMHWGEEHRRHMLNEQPGSFLLESRQIFVVQPFVLPL